MSARGLADFTCYFSAPRGVGKRPSLDLSQEKERTAPGRPDRDFPPLPFLSKAPLRPKAWATRYFFFQKLSCVY